MFLCEARRRHIKQDCEQQQQTVLLSVPQASLNRAPEGTRWSVPAFAFRQDVMDRSDPDVQWNSCSICLTYLSCMTSAFCSSPAVLAGHCQAPPALSLSLSDLAPPSQEGQGEGESRLVSGADSKGWLLSADGHLLAGRAQREGGDGRCAGWLQYLTFRLRTKPKCQEDVGRQSGAHAGSADDRNLDLAPPTPA